MIEPYRHSSWATLRLLEFCRELDPALLNASARGTFGTIKDTLGHLVGSEEAYLATASGAPAHRSSGFTSVDDLNERTRRLAEQWERFLEPEPHAERLVERRGQLLRLGTVLAQVIHHAGEHRTQICTILGTIDIEPPDLSGWAYGEWVMDQRESARSLQGGM
jgi:uncharacterized damage-inducible protein DinB